MKYFYLLYALLIGYLFIEAYFTEPIDDDLNID